MADLSDFNPVFSSKLDALKAALEKQGIGYSINSGYRSPEYQGRMYANHLAKQRGQPLPYPNDEAPAVVAPPWRSFHNYGLAADFTLKNDADYPRLAALAQQSGLTGIGPSDKGHIQLAGSLDDDINQYKLAGWRPASQPAPASSAVAYAGGPSGAPAASAPAAAPAEAPGRIDPSIVAWGGTSPPIPSTPGTTLNTTPVAGVTQGQWGQLAQNLKNTGKALGLSHGDDNAKQQDQNDLPAPPAPGARNVSFLLGGPGGIGQGNVSPAYAQRMAALTQPTTWGAAPPGQNPWTGYGPQAQPLVYGTSLATQLQRLSDPLWMNQSGDAGYG